MHSLTRCFVLSALTVGALARPTDAHISITSGPAAANKSSIITLGVGHGCEDANAKPLDTVRIRIAIPAGVTGVRALFSDFGKPTLIRSGTTVTHIEWTKPAGDLLDGDDGFYQLQFRARIPDVPFSKLKFDVTQTCEDSVTHAQVVTEWNAPEGSTTGEPAAFLTVVPVRTSGWNKLVVPAALAQEDLPTYLGDAQIVWKGNAAYSSNPNTAAMIATTPGVTALTGGLAAGDEIWVKY